MSTSLRPLPCLPQNTLQAELETRLQLGETAEQRRLRERNRVEEADNDLTEDLFGGGGAQGKGGAAGGLSGLALQNMQVCVYVCRHARLDIAGRLNAGEKLFFRRAKLVVEGV